MAEYKPDLSIEPMHIGYVTIETAHFQPATSDQDQQQDGKRKSKKKGRSV